jgi:hypothetical protein
MNLHISSESGEHLGLVGYNLESSGIGLAGSRDGGQQPSEVLPGMP